MAPRTRCLIVDDGAISKRRQTVLYGKQNNSLLFAENFNILLKIRFHFKDTMIDMEISPHTHTENLKDIFIRKWIWKPANRWKLNWELTTSTRLWMSLSIFCSAFILNCDNKYFWDLLCNSSFLIITARCWKYGPAIRKEKISSTHKRHANVRYRRLGWEEKKSKQGDCS